jgi:hypothetical protein
MVFFIPYFVQIMFHNSGPFYNDVILYFTTAAISVAPGMRQVTANTPMRPRVVSYVPIDARRGRRFGSSGLAAR